MNTPRVLLLSLLFLPASFDRTAYSFPGSTALKLQHCDGSCVHATLDVHSSVGTLRCVCVCVCTLLTVFRLSLRSILVRRMDKNSDIKSYLCILFSFVKVDTP